MPFNIHNYSLYRKLNTHPQAFLWSLIFCRLTLCTKLTYFNKTVKYSLEQSPNLDALKWKTLMHLTNQHKFKSDLIKTTHPNKHLYKHNVKQFTCQKIFFHCMIMPIQINKV